MSSLIRNALASRSSNMIAFIIASLAGGVGKTTLAQILEDMVSLSNLQLAFIDGDPANAGYSIETKDPRSVKLRSIIDINGDGVAGYVEKIKTAGTEIVILDAGAAMTSMDSSVVDGFRDLCELLSAAGFTLVSFFPVSTNKGQSSRQIETLLQRLGRLGQVVLAGTDAAGTNNYPDWLQTMDPPRVAVPRFAPGFVDLRHRHLLPMSDFLRLPSAELSICQAVYANGCLSLARQSPLTEAVQGWDLSALDAISQRSSVPDWLAPTNAAEALTSVLQCEIAYEEQMAEVFHAARNDPSHQCHAAVNSHDSWRNAISAASERLKSGSAQ